MPRSVRAAGTDSWRTPRLPFIVARLARAADIAPFDEITGTGWRSTKGGQVAVLGAIIAVASSFAPAVVVMTLVCAVAFVVGAALTATRDLAPRVLLVAVKSIAVAALLSLPWVIGTLWAGSGSVAIFGLPISSTTAPSWAEVLRFAIGPTARSPIVWLLIVAAALPLVIGRGPRLVWAARLWSLAVMSWVLAYAGTHGWTASFAPSESVVLAPAAVAIAAGIGLGVAVLRDRRGRRRL